MCTDSHAIGNTAGIDHSKLPPLGRDVSFWGMAVTQFLGAFNDNVFKQLMLLLATPTLVEMQQGKGEDLQSEAQYVFAGAFLIFSGFAGYLADRFSKRPVIILSKVAEIVAMLLGVVGFWFYGQIGFAGMLVVLFLMGMQSAFFGPAKYGILPESLRGSDLPRANGIFLMLTFVAIIFGMATAGGLLQWLGEERVWLASLACVGIAVVGTGTSLLVRRVPPARPGMKHSWSVWTVPREARQLLREDHQLAWALAVVALFWMVGGIVVQTVNALGKSQLGVGDLKTSILNAAMGVGIAVGCLLGGYLSRGRINPRVVMVGMWGLVVTLAVMTLPGGAHHHLLGYRGSIPVLIAMGVFTGMFIVPVQVLLQSRPPREQKGRMIATMNQCSWLSIILGAVVYAVSISVLDRLGGPRSAIFAVAAALMLPVALFYRPKDEALGNGD